MRAYTTDIRMMWLEQDLPTNINRSDLEDIAARWLNARRRGPGSVSPKTLGRRLTSVRALGSAIGISVLPNYNAPTPAAPEPHPLPEGVDGVLRMLDACNTDEQLALVTLCGLVGCRVAEARETAPTAFIFREKKLRIFGKGSKERVVPISDAAWEILLPIVVEAMSNPNEPIIKMGDRSARDTITRIGARAGLSTRVSSHDLRATFATQAYAKTKDLRAVQMLLGHASSKQTEVYVGIGDKALRDAANILSENYYG